MFEGKEYCNDTIEKLTALIGLLFSNVKYKTVDKDGSVAFKNTHLIYGQNFKQRKDIYDYIAATPEIQRQLPIISYYLSQISYNSTINRSATNSKFIQGTEVFAPVPYNFSFQFDIIAKDNVSGYSILEQILPYFTPSLVIRQQELKNLDINYDVSITLNSTATTPDADIDNSKLFMFNATFMLTVSANLYKFVNTDIGKQIEKIFINNKNITTGEIIESFSVKKEDL